MKKLFYLIITFTFASCTKSVHISDCTFIPLSGDSVQCYVNEELYDGVVWSSDDKTLQLIVKDGIVSEYTFYYLNGEKAIYSSIDLSEQLYFDKDGNEIDDSEFESKYILLLQDRGEAASEELKNQTKKK